MIRTLAALLTALCLAGAAMGQDAEEVFEQGDDRVATAATVEIDDADLDEVFAAGERVEVSTPSAGSVHVAARRIETAAAIGGALYAAGADVTVGGPVAGSASIAGYDVALRAPVAGNLRVFGTHVTLRGRVDGAVMIDARDVEISEPIGGDVKIAARSVRFGPDARIGGRLLLITHDGDPIEVPGFVIPAERIERKTIQEERPMMEHMAGPGWRAHVLGFMIGTIVLGLFAGLAAIVAPRGMVKFRIIIGASQIRAFAFGFLAQATLIGASILLAMSLLGIVLAPFILIGMLLLALSGYLVGVYLLGEWVLTRLGALDPDSVQEFLLAGLVGAAIVGLVSLAPLLGWIFATVLTLCGVGAITIARLRRYTV